MMLSWILIAGTLAAVPPLTAEDRAEQAAIIAVGTIISTTSEIIDYKEVTTAAFLVADVEKGSAPATISWWVPSGRPEGWVGHQGQSPVPTGTIRIFADELGELLTPNGWEAVDLPVEDEPVVEEPVVEEEEEVPMEVLARDNPTNAYTAQATYDLTAMVALIRQEGLSEEEAADSQTKIDTKDGHLIAHVKVLPPCVEARREFSAYSPMPGSPGLSSPHHPSNNSATPFSKHRHTGAMTTPLSNKSRSSSSSSQPVTPTQSQQNAPSDWILCNDFTFAASSPNEVSQLYDYFKIPAMLFYTRRTLIETSERQYARQPPSQVTALMFHKLMQIDIKAVKRLDLSFTPLDMSLEPPRKGTIFGTLSASLCVRVGRCAARVCSSSDSRLTDLADWNGCCCRYRCRICGVDASCDGGA